MGTNDLVVVTGAGGFIGGHLVAELRRRTHRRIRAVDIKPLDEWYEAFDDVENCILDLRERGACDVSAKGARAIFNLAADMGGMGFIELHRAECMLSVLINTHMLMAARDAGVERFFFSSSACVYAADRQTSPDVVPLRESDAYPAMPEDGYRSSSANACAATSRRISDWRRESRDITTSTVRMARTTVAAKKRRQRFAGR